MNDSISPVHFGGLDIHTAAGTLSDWFLHAFELEERIGEPYSLMLTVSCTDLTQSAQVLVGGRCAFRVSRDDFDRDIHGVVIKAETLGMVRGALRLRLWIGPSLELLTLSRRMRIFQGLTAVEIVASLVQPAFDRYGGELDTSLVDDLSLRVRDYCVQHDETDLQLAQRLLAEEGITFSFRHTEGEGAEVMVLLPGTAGLHSASGEHESTPRITRFPSHNPDLAPEETIQSLQGATQMRAEMAETSLWDWKANEPSTRFGRKDPFDQDADQGSKARFGELYEHEPYRPVEQTEGGPLFEQVELEADRLGQVHRVDDLRARGTGNVLGFTDGATFEIEQHPSTELEGRYAVLSVTHHAEFHEADDGVAQGQAGEYSNHFTCHRFATADDEIEALYVPPRRHKPRAAGPVTAIVVGPEGEEIHTDEHGRIKVRMHWDREGLARGDHETSCWVPVGQLWGGPGYGAVFIPRIGMEVVVSFIAGDPDRPLCTGVVYNGANQPPYPLPEHKTRTVLRTSSSPGGDGHNELSFEDAAGSEEVFLKAQRNLREAVGANQTTSVGVDHSSTVGQHRERTVGGHDKTTIDEWQQTTVGGVRETIIEGYEVTTVKCGAAKGEGSPGGHTNASWLVVHGDRRVHAYDAIRLLVGDGLDGETRLVITPEGVSIEAKEFFKVKVGDTEFVLTGTQANLETEAIELTAKDAGLTMHDVVRAKAKEAVELHKGDDCSLVLDGDAKLGGANVQLEAAGGEAKLKGMSAIIEAARKAAMSGGAGVSVDSKANVSVTAGGELGLKSTIGRWG